MSDERLRAEHRRGRKSGEWMQYLVAAQRAGISLEDALLETQGKAIELIQTNASDLSRFSDEVNAKIAEWMFTVEGLPCESSNPQLKNDCLVWTYAVLAMPQKAREYLPRIWYTQNQTAFEKLIASPTEEEINRLNPSTDMTVILHNSKQAEQAQTIALELKKGNMELAEKEVKTLLPVHQFRAYIDFSFILKNREGAQ
ncbi:hypothetical protein J4219_07875 [Candidatus Woesearchaeota archaeon]|nr:hypothetical protein [Candidatus Woesearchaeota archaeon]